MGVLKYSLDAGHLRDYLCGLSNAELQHPRQDQRLRYRQAHVSREYSFCLMNHVVRTLCCIRCLLLLERLASVVWLLCFLLLDLMWL